MAFEDILNRHHHCQVVIIPRYHKGKDRLIHGLYCQDHAKLIKWLSPNHSCDLQALGVEVLTPINTDRMSVMREKLKRQMGKFV